MIIGLHENTRQRWSRTAILLILTLVVLFVLSISLGSVLIPPGHLIRFILQGSTDQVSWDLILTDFRIPKAITSVLVGASLGISGLQMQTLFRNPLAGPYVLGISSGAGLGVALAIFLGFSLGGFADLSGIGRSWLLVVSAGIGGLLVLLVILGTARRLKDSVSLLIVGLMFGAASGALVSILQFFSKAENIQAYVFWSFGSLGNLSWIELSIMVPILVINLFGAILLSKPLNALLLGENYARSMGLNLGRTRILIILNTSMLAGTVTAFCGPIAFFGIALPHLSRMLLNTSNHLLLSPVIILFGGSLMLLFDILAQLPGLEAVLPINAVTALFGAPFVIYLLLKKKTLSYSYS